MEKKQCSYCGKVRLLERFPARGNQCTPCLSVKNRLWRLENPEKVKAIDHRKALQPGFRDRKNASMGLWRSENRGKVSEYNKQWAENNPIQKIIKHRYKGSIIRPDDVSPDLLKAEVLTILISKLIRNTRR